MPGEIEELREVEVQPHRVGVFAENRLNGGEFSVIDECAHE
jgi:hypothetical protein